MRQEIAKYEPMILVLTCLAACFTVFSQFLGGVFNPLYYSIWFLLLIIGLSSAIRQSAQIGGYTKFLLLAVCILISGCAICYLATLESGYLTGYLQLLLKMALMYCVGWLLFSSGFSFEHLSRMFVVYSLASLIYAAWVQASYFPSIGAWFDSYSYAFLAKNSFGQIAGVALIFMITVWKPRLKILNVLKYISVVYLLAVIFLAQCRTAILALAGAMLVFLILNKRYKVVIVVIVVATMLYLLIPQIQEFINHSLAFDKYKNAGVDDFSSGRIGYVSNALDLFVSNTAIGTGSFYVDCFYVSLFVNLGIVLGALFLAVWIVRIVQNLKIAKTSYAGKKEKFLPLGFSGFLIALTVFYFIESLLEGYPPFGPGACAFMFWFTCGYLDAHFAFAKKI